MIRRKRARYKEFYDTGERLKMVLGAAKIFDWSFDVKNRSFVALSENMAEIYGLREEDVALFEKKGEFFSLSYVIDNHNSPENILLNKIVVDKESRDQALLDAIKEKRSFEIVYEIIRLTDHQHRFLRWQARCVTDSKGNVTKVFGFTQDVTERNTFVEAIKQSEETFRFLFQSLPFGIAVLNNRGLIRRSNRSFSEIVGYSSEELILTDFIRFVFHEDPGKGQALFGEIEEGKRNTIHAVLRFTKKQGEHIYLDITIMAVRMSDGALDFAYGMIKDTTDERALVKQEEILSSSMLMMLRQQDFSDVARELLTLLLGLFDADRTFIFERDPEKESFNNTFEVTASGVISSKDNMQDVSSERYPYWYYQLKEGKTIAVNDVRALEKESPLRKFLNNLYIQSFLLVPIFVRDELWGFWGIEFKKKIYIWKEQDKAVMRNLTHPLSLAIDRYLAKQTLMEALKTARESDRMKTAFLAGMSHEIRTPLNAIVGFSDLIGEMIKESYPEIERFTDIIKRSNTQLLKIIGDMIDFSKIESNTVTIMPDFCHLNSLIESIVEENSYTMPDNVSLHLVPPEDNYTIETDAGRLRQVLDNLIINAKKFTKEGDITVMVHYDEEDDLFLFSVADTGIGIPNDQLDKIFERFVKLDMFSQGTGLGLSIVHSLVGYLGGSVRAESEEGTGSVFYVSIPRVFKKIEVLN